MLCPIGERRAPSPNNQPGYLRVDSVHQGFVADMDDMQRVRTSVEQFQKGHVGIHARGRIVEHLCMGEVHLRKIGIIDTPPGDWYAYLFQDHGAVGRIPYLVPVKWEDGWPVIGENGKVPDTLNLPASKGLIPGIVAPDGDQRTGEQPEDPAERSA